MKNKISLLIRLFLVLFFVSVIILPFKNIAQSSNTLFDAFKSNPSFSSFNLQSTDQAPQTQATVQSTQTAPAPAPAPTTTRAPISIPAPKTPQSPPQPVSTSLPPTVSQPSSLPVAANIPNPFLGAKLYVDPNCNAKQWVNANPYPTINCSLVSKIASQPVAQWFGNRNSNIKKDVSAATQNAVNSYSCRFL